MAVFPEQNPSPSYPLIIEPEFNTLIGSMDSGKEQRRQKLMFPRYNVSVRYKILTLADTRTLWNFYLDRAGASKMFHIYDLALLEGHAFLHTKQYCATANGVSTIYDIPGRSTSSQTIFVNDVETTGTILLGGGVANSDRVQFSVAPAAGSIITATFTGFLRIRARFMEDRMPRELFMHNLYTMELKLKGLSPH